MSILTTPRRLYTPSLYLAVTPLFRPNRSYSSPPPTIPSRTPDGKLTWDKYFTLRRKRKNMERGFLIPTSLLSIGGSVAYAATRPVDPTPIFGQDPIVMGSIGILCCGVAGVLIGPIIGSSVWKLLHREDVKLMEERDREFYQHIKRNRADPSLFSLRNPAPDYYGEKIKSVQEYRTWLRKQRECIRKGTFHIGEDT
ncbi:6062_t:CDS:2 [Paraglomus occultum]|uniref:Presequence translocated-associated motor subunit PAM17 n=1 Tax=Paraglomus occultum TaxID=144539 RepID=A0A9N9DBM0_9GLOM|nr:6062_t:CDS:2 [Paraglomus occultum]